MRIPIFLFISVLIAACGHDKNAINQTKIIQARDNSQELDAGQGGDAAGQIDQPYYKWTKKDKQKFLSECRSGADKELTGNKVKEFCDCMLIQSQRYYASYTEMEKASNEDCDFKILAACEGFTEQEEDEQE